MTKEQKKYKVIAKIDSKDFVKYNVNDLIKFTAFLDTNYPNWRWFNVYRYTKEGNGEQLESFTSKNRPSQKFVN